MHPISEFDVRGWGALLYLMIHDQTHLRRDNYNIVDSQFGTNPWIQQLFLYDRYLQYFIFPSFQSLACDSISHCVGRSIRWFVGWSVSQSVTLCFFFCKVAYRVACARLMVIGLVWVFFNQNWKNKWANESFLKSFYLSAIPFSKLFSFGHSHSHSHRGRERRGKRKREKEMRRKKERKEEQPPQSLRFLSASAASYGIW